MSMAAPASSGVMMDDVGAVADRGSHRQAVRAFVLRLTGNEALAEDLTQEAYMRAEKTRATLRKKSSEKSWLCSIALNIVRDHYRATARAPVAAPDPTILDQLPSADDTEETLLKAEMSSCLTEYVFRLPEQQRDAVALHDMAGLKHAEISAILGVSEANSRVLVHRGRTALRELLESNCILTPGDSIPCERKPGSCQ